ncbi:MAG: EamA family transporter RarD [Neisseria sp.]|nr:EamA family transporter RarD [Neisseria sp.]
MSDMLKGVALGLFSQILFGVLYLFSHWMAPVSGTDVFALRMLMMLIGLWAIVLPAIGWRGMADFVRCHLGKNLKRWALMLTGTVIVAGQFWLFMWAPVNGEGVSVAMGYFLFPLAMVLAGRLVFGERLNALQAAALLLAAAGVAHELWQTQALSWASVAVFAVYPPYYLSRRAMGIPALQGLTVDLCLIAPPALAYLVWQGDALALVAAEPRYWLLLPALGLASAAAMFANLKANALLPVTVFGMLSYVEPALLFVLAVTVLGEPVAAGEYITYGLIWAGLALLALNGAKGLKQSRKYRNTAV